MFSRAFYLSLGCYSGMKKIGHRRICMPTIVIGTEEEINIRPCRNTGVEN
jgi:hypothetical protein